MRKTLINLLLVLGILLINYPFIGRFLNKFNQNMIISNYKKKISLISIDEKEKMKTEYKNYNVKGKDDFKLLNNGVCLGYISIPKINVYLPIFEGTTDDVLIKGVGHLKNTSLPIGGTNTNSVLVGHTGITDNIFFDNLVKLELDDIFYIYVLDDVLQYKVSNIKVVLPDNTEDIKPIEEKEIVTLVTCTPKYINSHRLLIIGERVYNDNKEIENYEYNIYKINKFIVIKLIVLILIVFILIYYI